MGKSGISEDEIKNEIKTYVEKYKGDTRIKSEEFSDFKKELTPGHFTLYEKACNFCANIMSIKADKSKVAKIEEALETCHINTTPSGVTSFAILFPIAFILTGVLLSFLFTTFLMGGESTGFFIGVFLIFGIMMIIPLTTLPLVLSNTWRLRASNQMVLSVFYIVSYMRHTSNLELAIKFTSDHIAPPLAMDFKKIIWNVETSKYESMKSSVNNYLDTWKEYNMEFVEAMHLIESSLYESTEKKRVESLDKSLSLILESTYEKMLHFAQNLKSPITMLHMLGIILPILGLVILPLVISFMEGAEWYHISIFYNVFLPLLVWYLGKTILSTRPTGYGQADITDINPELKKHSFINVNLGGKTALSINPVWVSIFIAFIFILLGLSPLIMYSLAPEYNDYIVNNKYQIEQTNSLEKVAAAPFSFLGYKEPQSESRKELIGPYGLGATLMSIFIPLGLALAFGFYFKTKTKKLMNIREKTKKLENEFAAALFQLGNRLGDGLPAEIAFSKVAEVMENTISGDFFDLVTTNIATLGMGVEEAIFDKHHGAINKFPSALIESSMKVFIESAKKGPEVASQALINISTYIKEMHRVDERLKDLMAEITSSMKSQISFLAPLISGIVIGLSSMITTILNKLGSQLLTFSADSGGQIPGGAGGLGFGDSVPTFYFQLVVGIYVVQITYLLTQMLNTIENGYDPLNEKYLLGKNIQKSGTLYALVAFIVIMMFNLIASTVISGLVVVPS